MKRWFLSVCVILIVIIGLAGGCRKLYAAEEKPSDGIASKSDDEKAAANGPVALVRTTPVRKGTIRQYILVYGSVIAAPGALKTVSIPFESQMLRIMVNDGQKIAKGDLLLRIQPSPDTMLQLEQARHAYELQRESFRQMERRYNLKLATNEQLLQVRQTLGQAKLSLDSLTKRGIDGERKILSDVDGLIKKVYVQEGSIVPAGSPLIEIVAQNRLEALLGVEPEDLDSVHPGQPVSLIRVNAPASPQTTGQIREVSYAVNPLTRLVDVFVSLTSPSNFLLGESITGKIILTVEEGLIVPRSAVLPEQHRHVLFTIKDCRAVKHFVEISVEDAREFQIAGKDLQVGEQVVVRGNYELTSGMRVTTEACR